MASGKDRKGRRPAKADKLAKKVTSGLEAQTRAFAEGAGVQMDVTDVADRMDLIQASGTKDENRIATLGKFIEADVVALKGLEESLVEQHLGKCGSGARLSPEEGDSLMQDTMNQIRERMTLTQQTYEGYVHQFVKGRRKSASKFRKALLEVSQTPYLPIQNALYEISEVLDKWAGRPVSEVESKQAIERYQQMSRDLQNGVASLQSIYPDVQFLEEPKSYQKPEKALSDDKATTFGLSSQYLSSKEKVDNLVKYVKHLTKDIKSQLKSETPNFETLDATLGRMIELRLTLNTHLSADEKTANSRALDDINVHIDTSAYQIEKLRQMSELMSRTVRTESGYDVVAEQLETIQQLAQGVLANPTLTKTEKKAVDKKMGEVNQQLTDSLPSIKAEIESAYQEANAKFSEYEAEQSANTIKEMEPLVRQIKAMSEHYLNIYSQSEGIQDERTVRDMVSNVNKQLERYKNIQATLEGTEAQKATQGFDEVGALEKLEAQVVQVFKKTKPSTATTAEVAQSRGFFSRCKSAAKHASHAVTGAVTTTVDALRGRAHSTSESEEHTDKDTGPPTP